MVTGEPDSYLSLRSHSSVLLHTGCVHMDIPLNLCMDIPIPSAEAVSQISGQHSSLSLQGKDCYRNLDTSTETKGYHPSPSSLWNYLRIPPYPAYVKLTLLRKVRLDRPWCKHWSLPQQLPSLWPLRVPEQLLPSSGSWNWSNPAHALRCQVNGACWKQRMCQKKSEVHWSAGERELRGWCLCSCCPKRLHSKINKIGFRQDRKQWGILNDALHRDCSNAE